MDRLSYNIAIFIQQDATEYRLFKSVNCSTCFWWYFTHHQKLITLSKVSGINDTCTANCRERGWVVSGSSRGIINARYCR